MFTLVVRENILAFTIRMITTSVLILEAGNRGGKGSTGRKYLRTKSGVGVTCVR